MTQQVPSTGIEDQIIAYLDGRLNDTESAELLHRVSVSPEIRQAFQEHRELRMVAQQARMNAMIRPEVEERLFAHIEKLAEGSREEEEIAAPFWVRGRAVRVAFLMLIAFGLYAGYRTIEANQDDGAPVKKIMGNRDVPLLPGPGSAKASTPIARVAGSDNGTIGPVGGVPPAPSKPPVLFGAINKNLANATIYRDGVAEIDPNSPEGCVIALNHLIAAAQVENSEKVEHVMIEWEAESCSRDELGLDPLVHPINFDVPDDVIGAPVAKTIAAAQKGNPDEYKHFEATLESSSGITIPATGTSVSPFTDFRFSGAYALTESDLLGARVINGVYDRLLSNSVTVSDGTSSTITRSAESGRRMAAEIFYTRRFDILEGKLQLDASAGAGYVFPTSDAAATTFSLEFGARIPLSSHIYFDATVGVTRYHSTAPNLDQVLSDQSSSGVPTMVEGSNVHNTMNGRLFYGLSYRF